MRSISDAVGLFLFLTNLVTSRPVHSFLQFQVKKENAANIIMLPAFCSVYLYCNLKGFG